MSGRGSGGLIPKILGFFRANRDGAEPALMHGPSHLNDATIKGGPYDGQHVDLTGGWMDAGDMIHFTQNAALAPRSSRRPRGSTARTAWLCARGGGWDPLAAQGPSCPGSLHHPGRRRARP